MEKRKYILPIFLILVLVFAMWTIISKNKKIEALEKEKPLYIKNQDITTEYRYFNYADEELSWMVEYDKNYGCDFKSSDLHTRIYCEFEKERCKVEITDNECLSQYTGENFSLSLGESGCVRVFEIKGSLSKREY